MEELLNEGDKVTIDGTEYKVKRLSTRDVFRFVRMISKLGLGEFASMMQQSKKDGEDPAGKGSIDYKIVGFKLVSNITRIENEVMEFAASKIGVKVEEFEEMPADALIDVLQTVFEGNDMKAFFSKVNAMMDKMSVQKRTGATIANKASAL
ncbi:hypothetical protein LC040_12130 [Bacillus tianshenii]|nr:hypothetical protein LC040_12130 [Bacillus tianshenii]